LWPLPKEVSNDEQKVEIKYFYALLKNQRNWQLNTLFKCSMFNGLESLPEDFETKLFKRNSGLEASLFT